MTNTELRTARVSDAARLSEMARAMVTDMANHGGHPVSIDESSWTNLADIFTRQIGEPDFRYIVAESTQGEIVGFAGGEVRKLGGAYAPKRILHISAVYVLPESRRRGLGGSLISDLLEWGRKVECVEAELNVVEGNPAVALYEKVGFSTFQRALVCPL
jgi:GNAT superfamily N-acetyltransferase